jgi:hypothetical protein
MRVLAGCIAALCLIATPAMAGANGAGGNAAADPSATSATSANATTSSTSKPEIVSSESDIQQLKDLLDAQSKQLQQQQQELQQQQQEMNALKQQLNLGASSNGVVAAAPVVAPVAAAIGPVVGASTAILAPATPAQTPAPAEPASLIYKGITLTPGGFMAAESAWRQRGLGADVNSPFNTIPFPGAENAHVSEFNASGRQSRISMLVQGKLKSVTIGGYYETDFLSAGVTSNNNQSNSYTLRQRQFWGQAAFTNGLTITAGQMWSLATETKSGVSNRTEATPMTIDAQYNVGFTWARQYGFRVAQKFGKGYWLAASVEDAETTVGVHGQNNNFLLGTAGVTSGLFNNQANYNFSASPDFIVKGVAEPGFGHYEVFGILSSFRDRIYPGGATAPYNSTIVGGGVGANARWAINMNKVDKADLGIHFLGGDGVGRYGSTGLADVTVRPNGTLVALHSFQGLGTAELHPVPSLDVYFNLGGEYNQRAQYINGAGTIPNDGYGAVGFNNSGCWTELAPGSGGFTPTAPGTCTGDTKDIFEGTVGFWQRPYKGSKGTVQWGLQYSYFVRNTWQGTGTGATSACATNGHPTCAPSGQDSMVFTSFRYYLP